jgi:CheY-like chemotaxis protein
MIGAILLVDDDASLRRYLRRFLELEGYVVLEAEHGRAALHVITCNPQIGLVLTDVNMPVMDGHALAAAIVSSRPELPIVFMSGDVAALESLARFGVPYLAKPFGPDELLATIGARLDGWALSPGAR